ncbi:MAG: DUF2236 domain-containing protein [Chitinophagaceae bacterium]|nr:DUF2236 domain-containing protein [Chitinophagaceae bacterium]
MKFRPQSIVYNNDLLSARRSMGDPLADVLIQTTFKSTEYKVELRAWLDSLTDNSVLSTDKTPFQQYPLVVQSQLLPVWAEKKQMARGTAFFNRYSDKIMSLLGLLSLPYCYAASRGAMVLYLSERMRADPQKRLLETAEFVWDVMDPDAFTGKGRGFSSILKVRLMHAAVRYYTLASGKWDDSWGMPVNQEDMAGTNLSFSLIVVRGLRKFGIAVSYDEQQAFMHLWNVIGSMLGVQEDLLPQEGKQAIQLEELIRERQFEPSEQGRALTRSLTGYFSSVATGAPFSAKEIFQVMRYLLGDPVADILEIASPGLPPDKIRLLKLANSFSLPGFLQNSGTNYDTNYRKFKQEMLMLG